jgi:hypothetical protein
VPLGLAAIGLAAVTVGAVRAIVDDPSFLSLLRLVIEAIATGYLAVATWRVATSGQLDR